jgi:hypothetical protein
MKRYIEPILLILLEVLLLIFMDIDKSAIFLLAALTFGYFFIRRFINQNQAVLDARSHKILAGSFRSNPIDTFTLQKGIGFEKTVTNKHMDHMNVKWLHLIFCVINISAIILVILDIIPY